jgi:hypothetical protein
LQLSELCKRRFEPGLNGLMDLSDYRNSIF